MPKLIKRKQADEQQVEAPVSTKDAKSESVRKFGAAVAARFTIVPALLFEKQHELKIKPIELAIILQLMSFWWKADSLPWPSKKALGLRLGMHPSNVRRHITRLCNNGLLERRSRRKASNAPDSNEYSFKPLIKKLRKFAEQREKEKLKVAKR